MSNTDKTKNDTEKQESKTDSSETATSPPPKEMRAILLSSFGGLKNVKVVKKPQPSVTKDNVLLSVKACGLNFGDLMIRQGVLDNVSKPPFIMGSECAGVIEEIGEGVEGLKVGDKVFALVDTKAWAEFVLAPANCVYKLPDGMSFSEAVAITMNFTVAHCLLFDVSNLKSGQTVLIHSVGGGVGQALVQLTKLVPNVTIIGTASKHKHDQLKGGVTHLLEHSSDYLAEVKKLSPNGVDLVLDCICGVDANIGYNLLKPMGHYVLYGTACVVSGETKSFLSFAKSWFQVGKISPTKLYEENKTLSGFNLRRLLFQQNQHEYVRNVIEKIYKMYDAKTITPVVDSVFAFEDIAEAMQKLHERKNIGKVVLDPSAEPKPRPVEEEVKGKRKSSSKDKENEKREANANGEAEEVKEGKDMKESKEESK